jgi:hypothetical protein
MLNLLVQAFQVQLNDGASVQALINIITGVMAVIACVLFIYRWRLEVLRVALAGFFLFLAAWGAAAYAIVLFVDTGLNVSLLRWVISGWHIAAVGGCLIMHMVASYDPEERAAQEIEKLKDKLADAISNTSNWQNVAAQYTEREKKWTAEKEQLNADTTEIRKALEREKANVTKAREDAGNAGAKLIEAETAALEQERAINALKRQITLMEMELRKVKGGGAASG